VKIVYFVFVAFAFKSFVFYAVNAVAFVFYAVVFIAFILLFIRPKAFHSQRSGSPDPRSLRVPLWSQWLCIFYYAVNIQSKPNMDMAHNIETSRLKKPTL